jgi:carbon-monoxide dehydrogenase medium subunit
VPNLAGVSQAGDGIKIGAMTTLSDIAADAAIRGSYPVLAKLANETGDAQLRNRATIGGSLATGEADNAYPAMAVLLDARIEVTGPKGARTIAADDWLSGKGALAQGEIITALTLPGREPRTGVSYQAHANPATLAPLCAVGVGVVLASDGAIAASRVVLVGGGERPTRMQNVEKQLAKKRGDEAVKAARSAGDGITMRSDLFASADYRTHLTRVLTERAIKQALERAGG